MTGGLRAALGLERGLAAVVGAGGKTTLLFRLAEEARAAGWSVIVTTTTHMGLPTSQGEVFFEDEGGADAEAALRRALDRERRAVVLGRRLRDDKVQGIAPERADALTRLADLVLVEADGARRRSFKFPAEHEPVVPPSAGLVVVVAGLDVLGVPLDDAHVHRWERVAAATGQAVGSTVTEDTLVCALVDPSGYLARVPPRALSVVFLNKAEGDRAAAGGRIAARLVPPFTRALAGSAREGVLDAVVRS